MVIFNQLDTPLGQMFAAASDNGLCMLEFTDRYGDEFHIQRLGRYFKTDIISGHHPVITAAERQLDEYFSHQRQAFDVPLDLHGTDFQQRVWQILTTIPYGSTRSYQEQARAFGNENAIRAVAKANGDNPVAIIVPCHRVIGKDGSLTGYGGGLWRKQKLLQLEGIINEQPALFD